MTLAMSSGMKEYFSRIEKGVQASYKTALQARKKNLDPEPEVPIPLAKNMAERVVGLISAVFPAIIRTNITERIMELEKKYGLLDWRVGLTIAEEVAKEKFCQFESKIEAMEIGIRLGFAYLTLGIVSAPLEGFIGLKIKKRRDGKEYFALQYAGPIRGAGGTAASTSVILADYVRVKMGYLPYDPDEIEINRYITEVNDYHDRVTNLQYQPSEEELRFMISHLPVEVDGDPTEKFEVSNYKDLPRIETNLLRGGVPLVLAEGLCQKAPKLWKRLAKWGKELGLEWEWLAGFLKLKEQIHAKALSAEEKEDKKALKPNHTFIMDLVAGRPVLTHPLAVGGFRLRYGRNRTSGLSAASLHPATLIVLDKYIAIGTQLKVERPGKATAVTVCDTLEGPIVRLKDGTVLQLKTEEEAKRHQLNIREILFLGDVLFNYGDFSENGHRLVPAGYCLEWWSREVERAVNNMFEKESFSKAAELLGLKEEKLKKFIKEPLFSVPSWEEALKISRKLKVPLHPDYLLYWKLIPGEQVLQLKDWLLEGKVKSNEQGIAKIILPFLSEEHLEAKKILEHLGAPHQVVNKENILLERKEANIIASCFDFRNQEGMGSIKLNEEAVSGKNGLEVVNFLCNIPLRDKAGTFIGARMGRPEKAKMRQMTGSPQVMFPVGEEGDRLRSFQSALQAGKVRSTFPLFYCSFCQKNTVYPSCEICGKECQVRYHCRFCGDLEKNVCRHGKAFPYKTYDLDVKHFFGKALESLGEKVYPDLIKGIRGTSNRNHLVEQLSKGILRAKHRIYVNKDGTTRYDCTELPLTHFKAKEIKTSVEKLKELGYQKDINGKKLVDNNQILELKPQDLILPGFDSLDDSAPQVLTRVAKFVDDLLVKFYGLKPFYRVKKEEDLVGHLVIGLAPHISAGLVGRIVGFSETQGLLTHPMFHAGLRRDCLHPETRFVYEDSHGNIRYGKIGPFVEKLIKKGAKTKKIDNFGTRRVECDQNYFVFGINPKTNTLKKKRVKYFIKAPAPKKWAKVKTATGRELVMTETHDFMHLKDGKLVLKKAKRAKVGDKIPVLNLKNVNNSLLKKRIYKLTYNRKLFNKKYFKLKEKEDYLIDQLVSVEFFKEKVNSYCLNINYSSEADKNILWGEQIINTRCDGDEAAVILLMDALLNFSRKYLPERRGAKHMDAALVLTSTLNPSEVDDQVHGLDVVWKYPLEFYEAALEMKNPWEVKSSDGKKIEQLGDRLGTEKQYEDFGFTHHVDNFNKGVKCSAYKTQPSMEEKLIGQMEIARKVRAVDMDDVARLVIQKHFLKDIRGNLRQFSMQQFRCVKCNEKYPRPPLSGKCQACGGKLIFTVTEGSVVKYLGLSLTLAEKYNFSPYLKQSLELLKMNVDNVFGKEKEKQVGLGGFMGRSTPPSPPGHAAHPAPREFSGC